MMEYTRADNIMEFMLQKLQTAKQKLNHIPYIVSSHKKMAVWSDIRETLFVGCAHPRCSIVLNALKHELNYPSSEMYMHACTQTEQLQFLRQFVIVSPGTLLVDLNCLKSSERLMKLHDMVAVKHRKSKDSSTLQCNNIAKSRGPESVPCKDTALHVKKGSKERLVPAVIRNEHESNRASDGHAQRKKRGTQKIISQPLISRKVYSQGEVGKALTPLSFLKETFPECHVSLQEVAEAYMRRCTDKFASITRCWSEEGQKFSAFLAVYKGYGKPWYMVTSLSLMMSWEEFWRCCHSNSVTRPVIMATMSVCILNVQPKTTEPRHDKVVEKTGDDQQSEGPLASSSLTDIDVIAMANNMAKVGISESEDETGISDKMNGGEIDVEKHEEKLDVAVAVGVHQSNRNIQPEVKTNNVQPHKEGPAVRKANKMASKANVSASGKNSENTISSSKNKKMTAEKKSMKNIQAKKKSDEKGNSLNNEKEDVENKGEKLLRDLKSSTRKKSKYSKEDKVTALDTFKGMPISMNRTDRSKVSVTRIKKVEDKSKPDMDCTVDNIKTKLSKSDTSCSSKMNQDVMKANVSKGLSADNSKRHNKQKNIKKPEFKTELNNRSVMVPEYAAGDNVTNSFYTTSDKKKISVNSNMEEYEKMISSMKGSTIKQSNKNNNGNLKRNTGEEKHKSLESREKDGRVENIGKTMSNNREKGDQIRTLKDVCCRTASFDFKDYLEASYTKDGVLNMQTEEELAVTQNTELCPSQYLNLNPSTIQKRPYTADPYDARMDKSDNKGSRYQCKSAFTRTPTNMLANKDYYSVQRSKHFPKRTQANAVTVLSTSLKQNKKQNATLVEKTDPNAGDEKSNKINVYLCGKAIESPRDKCSEDLVASGDKTDLDCLSKDAAENWVPKEIFKTKKQVENKHIDFKIVSETNEQMERLSKLASEKQAKVVAKKSYVVTSQTLDKIKDLNDQYGQHKKMKEAQMIDKDLSDLEVFKDKSCSDIDKSDTDLVADQLVRETTDSIVIPCESLHTSIYSASVGDLEPVNDNSAVNIKAPSYGSSSSCAPDMYDMYARKPKPKATVASPVKKPTPSPNSQNFNSQTIQKIAVGGEKKSLVDTKSSITKETKEEIYTLKYTHTSTVEPETSIVPKTSADKVFRDLLALCKDTDDKDKIKENRQVSSQSEKSSNCDDCILCQAKTISARDKDKILNQLAFHVMEKMKDLNMKVVKKDKTFSEEEGEGEEEDNTPAVRLGLLDKLNWFGTDAVMQGKETDNDVTAKVDEQMDSENRTEREYDCNLKAQNFFVPVKQPVFSKSSKQDPLQKLREKAYHSPETELNIHDSKIKPDELFLVPKQMQGKEMNYGEKLVIPVVSVIVPQMEEEEVYAAEDDQVQVSSEEMNIQRIQENTCSAKQLNMELTLDESSDHRSLSAKAFTKNVRPKSARKRFCPMSIRQSMAVRKMEMNSPGPVAATAKSAAMEGGKFEIAKKSHWQSSRLLTQDASFKFMPQAKLETKKQKKNAKKRKNDICTKEKMGHLEDSVVVPLTQQSLSGSIGKGNEDSDVKAKRMLRNRTSKSARTAAEATDQQNQPRGRRYEERQKRMVKSKALDPVTSEAESTFYSAVKPDAPLNNRQKKLRVFLQSQLKKKREAVWKRKVVSAPSPASANQSNNHYSKGPGQKRNRQNTPNKSTEIVTSKWESNEMNQSSCLDKHKSLCVEEDNTGVDLNLNNNTNRETGGMNMGMEGKIVPPQIDHIYDAEHTENANFTRNSFEIEFNVDEVIDWEFPSSDTTRAVGEITYTITHTDGTQLIVSNNHPDFENIVKFIEEKKRLHGDDSITIEAELKLNQAQEEALNDEMDRNENDLSNDKIDSNDNDLSLFDTYVKIEDRHVTESYTKPAKNVGSVVFCKSEQNTSLESGGSHNNSSDTERRSMHLNSSKLSNVHATAGLPVEHVREDSDSYSIYKTLRNLIPEEMITKCFTEKDSSDLSDYKGTSPFTGEECKHHGNIFEAFGSSIFGAERGENVQSSTDNDSAIADIWSSDSQETVTEQELSNKDVYELLPDTSTSSFIKSEEFESVIRDANPWTVEKIDVLSSYNNEMMSECEIKDANILQKECITNLLNKRTNAISEKAKVEHGQQGEIGPDRNEGLLCLAEDHSNVSIIEDTELYEVLHVPECSNDASMVIVEESGAKIGFSDKVTHREQFDEEGFSSSVQDKEMSIPILIAEPEISVPVIVSSDSNRVCSSKPDALVNDVYEIKDVEDVSDQVRSKLTAENTVSSIKYDVGEIADKDDEKQGLGDLNEVNDDSTGASEGSFSDFEETLYDQEDIVLGCKDDCVEEYSNETPNGKSMKKRRTKCIRKSAQELFDNLERSIEKSFSEPENQSSVDIKENLDRREKSCSETVKQSTVDKNIDNKEINDDKKCIKNGSVHARKREKGRRKSTKLVSGDEGYDEEEDRRKERVEQIAAEGFIKTQQKYMQIVLNNSLECQRGKGETVGPPNAAAIHSSEPSSDEPEFSVDSLPQGMPVHGDRQCFRYNDKPSQLNSDVDDEDDDDVGVWIEDPSNNCRYQLIDDEDGVNLGGLAFYKNCVFPYVYINGYKFTPMKDVLQCFPHCQPSCRIPRAVLSHHKHLVKSLSTWEQVYKLELIMAKRGYSLTTGDVLVKLDNLVSLLPELTREIVQRHKNTTLKRSKNCHIGLYSVRN